MTLTWVTFVFLVAAILFGLDFLLGWGFETQYAPFRFRLYSLCWALIAIGLLLWRGGH